MNEPRYRRTVLATCCVPWDERGMIEEELFRASIKHLVGRGFRDLYLFGTAGEGHNVSDAWFKRIAEAFCEELAELGAPPMIGVISQSLQTVIERIELGASLGCRAFQLTLPNWGVLKDGELKSFFRETCGRFPQLEFLHYNLRRAGRVLVGRDYAELAAEHPNLIGTKYGGGDPELINGLLVDAPMLRHFFTELGFFYGSVVGPCALLASISATNPARAREYLEAGARGDVARLAELYGELAQMMVALRRAVGSGPHLDGAYDKILAKVAHPEFPLRLIGPYESSTDEAYETYRRFLAERFPAWL